MFTTFLQVFCICRSKPDSYRVLYRKDMHGPDWVIYLGNVAGNSRVSDAIYGEIEFEKVFGFLYNI